MPDASVSFSILMFVTIICLIVLTIFICKLIVSAINFLNNANIIATSVQKEVEPTLKELKEAAKSINSIANNADEKFQKTKSTIASVIGAGALLSGKLKDFSKGIAKGISFGMNLFKK